MDVDGVFGTWARLYVLPEEADKLRSLGYALSSLDPGHEGIHDVGDARPLLPGAVPRASAARALTRPARATDDAEKSPGDRLKASVSMR